MPQPPPPVLQISQSSRTPMEIPPTPPCMSSLGCPLQLQLAVTLSLDTASGSLFPFRAVSNRAQPFIAASLCYGFHHKINHMEHPHELKPCDLSPGRLCLPPDCSFCFYPIPTRSQSHHPSRLELSIVTRLLRTLPWFPPHLR